MDLSDYREHYDGEALKEPMPDQPWDLLKSWVKRALDEKSIFEPNAMSLATVDKTSKPSLRVVLFKEVRVGGIVFYTNYNSRKGQEIESNSKVSLVFCWLELARQIRIEGVAQKIIEDDSDDYFHTRPMGSQLAAWASPQSKVVKDREILETRMQEYRNKFTGEKTIPRPPYWGGYKVIPKVIEFWQGRQNRFHDRLQYTKIEENNWKIERLAP